MRDSVTLKEIYGPNRGRTWTFEAHDTFIFGRAPDCHTRITGDPCVSRHHFLLEVNPPEVRLRDLGSFNGTFVNGLKVGGRQPHETPEEGALRSYPQVSLDHEDVIRVGRLRLQVTLQVQLCCWRCGVELPEDRSRDVPSGNPVLCPACSLHAQRGAVVARALHPLACCVCGRDVAQEVRSLMPGDYVCRSCREQAEQDPFPLLRRMSLQVLPGQTDGGAEGPAGADDAREEGLKGPDLEAVSMEGGAEGAQRNLEGQVISLVPRDAGSVAAGAGACEALDETGDGEEADAQGKAEDSPGEAAKPGGEVIALPPARGAGLRLVKPREAPSPLEKYEVGRLLGRGGMGAVYLARRRADDRLVALKVMLARVAVREYERKAFLREIAISRELRHENVVALYDHGPAGAGFFFVMELCPGGSLAHLQSLCGGRLGVRDAGVLVLQALEGLAYAHAQGVVHRDLKPSNLMLPGLKGGGVRIADFGLARSFVMAGFSGMTMTDATAGTPQFMAREQVTRFRELTPVSDVWSMGATLYHLLTGAYPRNFPPGSDPMRVILEEPVIPLQERLPSVSTEVAAVVDRAVADDLAVRYPSAEEFAAGLRAVLPPERLED